MNKSIWQSFKSVSNCSNKNMEVDTLIIGGGITGLSTLFEYRDAVLIEANKIGFNTTGKSTAKISVMQGYNYQNMEKVIGKSKTQRYLKSQIFARDKLVKIINDHHIDCDLKKNSSYLFTNVDYNIDKIFYENKILNKQIDTKVINKLPNNYPCIYGIESSEYVFNPIKYMLYIKKLFSNRIFENTRALSIEKKFDYYLVRTNKNKIKAHNVVICTHYPIFIKKYCFPFKLSILSAYVLSAKCNGIDSSMISNDDELTSIRYYNDNILFSGFLSRIYNIKSHSYFMGNLVLKFKNHFNYSIVNTWYNYDIVSNDYLPIIGKLRDENIYFATAFNKWGITNGVLTGSIISDLINGNDNEFASLFSYYRGTNFRKIFRSFSFVFYNLLSFFNGQRIKSINDCDKHYSIVVDKNGKEHKVISKCPHMRCKVIFNDFDETWDCPCHGSRFDIDGKVIKGPSVSSLKK